MENFVENAKIKRKNMKDQITKNELKECTFVPNISQSFLKREAKQYTMDRDAYSIRAKINLNRIIAEECPRFSFRPLIDARSNLIASTKDRYNTPIYERLYELSSREKVVNENSEPVLSKQKRLKKNQSSSVIRLYEDAKARDMSLKSKRKALEIIPKQCYKYIRDQHVINKFLKEFTHCLSSLDIDWEKNPWIEFAEMKELMVLMGFTTSNNDKEQYEALLNKLFTALDEKDKGKVNIDKLRIVIAGILNIALDSKKSALEIHKLHKQYKLLYLLKKSNNSSFYKQEIPNKVKVPVKSRKNIIRHVDSLIQIKEQQERNLTLKRREEEKKELNKCTFKPKTNTYTRLAFNKSLNQFPIFSEAPRNPKPKVNNSKKKVQLTSRQKDTHKTMDSLTEKTIKRMQKAREDRERVKKMLERTTETDYMRFSLGKDQTKPKSDNKSRTKPLLKIEINVGEKAEEVLVYEGDTAENLAKDFCASHSKLLIDM